MGELVMIVVEQVLITRDLALLLPSVARRSWDSWLLSLAWATIQNCRTYLNETHKLSVLVYTA